MSYRLQDLWGRFPTCPSDKIPRRNTPLIRTSAIPKKIAISLTLVSLVFAQDHPIFKVKVDMVVLSFQVTDNKGRYINGLKPKDFRVLEDGIPQKFVTFAEGSKPPVEVSSDGALK